MTIAERGPSTTSGQTNPAGGVRMSKADDAPGFFPDSKLVEDALESANIGVWSWDIASNRVTWSRNLEAIHRLPPGSFDGTIAFVQNDMHPDDRPQMRAAIEEALRTGAPFRMLYRLPPRARRPGALDRVASAASSWRTARPSACSAPAGTSPTASSCTANCAIARASRRPSRGLASAR